MNPLGYCELRLYCVADNAMEEPSYQLYMVVATGIFVHHARGRFATNSPVIQVPWGREIGLMAQRLIRVIVLLLR